MKQPITFKVKKFVYVHKGKRVTGFYWQEIHANGNKVNHNYNSKSGCKAKLKSFIKKIQKGEFVIE